MWPPHYEFILCTLQKHYINIQLTCLTIWTVSTATSCGQLRTCYKRAFGCGRCYFCLLYLWCGQSTQTTQCNMTGWQWIRKCMERRSGSPNHTNISPDSSCPARHTNCIQVLPLRERSSYFTLHQFKFRLQSVLLITLWHLKQAMAGNVMPCHWVNKFQFFRRPLDPTNTATTNLWTHPLNNTASRPCRLVSPATPSEKCKYCIWPQLLSYRLHTIQHSQISHSFLLNTT